MKYFAESKGLKHQLSPALIKLSLTSTSVGSGSGCIYTQYPYACNLERIFLSPLSERDSVSWEATGCSPSLPTSHGGPVSDCRFWSFLFSLALLITTAMQSSTVISAKSETSEVMYDGAFS